MYYTGLVAATIANTAPFGDSNRQALTPMDFFPDLKPRQLETRTQTVEEMISVLTSAFGCGPGKKPN